MSHGERTVGLQHHKSTLNPAIRQAGTLSISPSVVQPPPPSALGSWLQLMRAPNLLTVPGDPIAGYLLASAVFPSQYAPMVMVVLASLAFYVAGLILNDLADIDEDRRDRPDRPLPSGRINTTIAMAVTGLLFLLAIVLCVLVGPQTFWVGICLFCAILTYNLGFKRISGLGVLNMGLCRGLNILLGVSAVYRDMYLVIPALTAAAIVTVFIISVTALARNETRPRQLMVDSWVPAATLSIGFVFLTNLLPQVPAPQRIAVTVTYGIALLLCITTAVHITVVSIPRNREPAFLSMRTLIAALPHKIGLLISCLMFLQAAFILASGQTIHSWVLGLGLVALWPANRWLSKRFYAS